MRFFYVLSAAAAIASAAPSAGVDELAEADGALSPHACLPASCQSFGAAVLLWRLRILVSGLWDQVHLLRRHVWEPWE
ncbi:hypothetical protein VTK73DRAFT_962 [Phialemonium thermophilum]|uniref:Uncharacterized protein n=1 Tax=Phialemonium thermophilum TaxID=223376 RepID=A0ABR3VU90_9PEZI